MIASNGTFKQQWTFKMRAFFYCGIWDTFLEILLLQNYVYDYFAFETHRVLNDYVRQRKV